MCITKTKTKTKTTKLKTPKLCTRISADYVEYQYALKIASKNSENKTDQHFR